MKGSMGRNPDPPEKELPLDFFDMEIVSNRPDNVELNEGSSSSS